VLCAPGIVTDSVLPVRAVLLLPVPAEVKLQLSVTF
jgi:hypothetical protein